MAGYDYRARDKGDALGDVETGIVDAPDIVTATKMARQDADKRVVEISKVNAHE